ncbi:glutamine synthetase [Streptomyces sp. NPDC004778]
MRRSHGLSYVFVEVSRPPRDSLRNKKQEWEGYRSEVTAFELRALLPVLQGTRT